jgi:hypothetical protein
MDDVDDASGVGGWGGVWVRTRGVLSCGVVASCKQARQQHGQSKVGPKVLGMIARTQTALGNSSWTVSDVV